MKYFVWLGALCLVTSCARHPHPGPLPPTLRAQYDAFKGRTRVRPSDSSLVDFVPSLFCDGHTTHCPASTVYIAVSTWSSPRPTPYGDFNGGRIYFLGDDSVRVSGAIEGMSSTPMPTDDITVQSGVVPVSAVDFHRLASAHTVAMRYGNADSASVLSPTILEVLRALDRRVDR